ncbi:hypothetical protein FQR65_LT20346 [Abscondita terminalis]|nr:hypothetical protein FQR65_LT20346 [Abscondita terminalis]
MTPVQVCAHWGWPGADRRAACARHRWPARCDTDFGKFDDDEAKGDSNGGRPPHAALGGLAAAPWLAAARAQGSPYNSAKAITLVVPQAAGGATTRFGPRAGAGACPSNLRSRCWPPGFDPVKDFEAHRAHSHCRYVLVANPSFAANSVAELMARPSPSGADAGIRLTHVPYKGSAAAATDCGRRPGAVVGAKPAVGHCLHTKSGTSSGAGRGQRPGAWPPCPPFAHHGENPARLGQAPWYAMFAPAATPAAIVQKALNAAALNQRLGQRDVQDKLAAGGLREFRRHASPQLAALGEGRTCVKWSRSGRGNGATLG